MAVVLVHGTGSIGLRHLRAAQSLGHRAIAVPVRSERRVELEREGFETAGSSAEAAAMGATAAVVATDTGRHVGDCLDALRAGVDVLIEKPVAPRAEDAAALVDATRVTSRRAFVAYCLRFHEGLARFRAALQTVGAVHHVRVACESYLPEWRPDRDFRASYSARPDEGGALRDLSHDIDYAMWLFGPVHELRAIVSDGSRLGIASDAAADLLWRTDKGAVVSVRVDYLTRASRRHILAQGERGEIEWDAVRGTLRTALAGAEEEVRPVKQDRDEMMQDQLAAFLDARTRTDDRLCALEDGIRVAAVCDEARRQGSLAEVQA